MYTVRKLKLGKTEQLDTLALESGRIYSQTVIQFLRLVRKKNVWLSYNSMDKLIPSSCSLHSQSRQAAIEAYYASLKSWRIRRKQDPRARLPKRRVKYFKITWKSTAIRVKDGHLVLANKKGTCPVRIPWEWGIPKVVEIGWDGSQHELRAVYATDDAAAVEEGSIAGIDLGEIHMAVSHDGENCHILNGRVLRSKRQFQNKLKAKLQSKLDKKKKGSASWKRIQKSKRKQLKKLDHQIKDILHKQTTALVSTLRKDGVQTLAIGDVRDLRKSVDYGASANQRIHQMTTGKTRELLTYKAERLGMKVVLQDERYTSQECPICQTRHKPRGRVYKCACGFSYHRDGVGSFNIRKKYLGAAMPQVVGAMTSPTGMRYHSHTCVALNA